MNRYIIFILSFVLLFSGIACTRQKQTIIDQSTSGKLQVAATIFPLYDILKQVGGEYIDAHLILPPGSSPHTFDITPQTLKDFSNVSEVFIIGYSIDGWADKMWKNGLDITYMEVSDGVSLRESMDPEDGFLDLHYWLDPENAVIISNNVANRLSEIDPLHAVYYQTNAGNFADVVHTKDIEWKQKLSNIPHKEFITFHDSFFYFANHFGLTIAATFEPFPGKEPTPQYLRDVQTIMKEKNITTLFLEPQLSQEAIKAFAQDTQATIKILDPLGGIEGRNSYIGLIEYNVNVLAGVL